ncbi:50S ribosomal protein L13 [Candidatus Aerophobetes bacterium]|uniref:Large ribosomal subunit protein uL13 n=1 Tax=Aerophobetes bacterium TaxID=2030807 RepID=A0A523WA41_UNCAE|nr:MAG: 50S ribosomal protein L13 [Candidatus Aerophobetes bacterium]
MKTYIPKPSEIERKWYLVNAEGKILGRLSSRIAQILSGKDKPTYTPHMDVGDFVVVINAEKVKVTGNKEEKKIYYWHSGYPGGLKERTYQELLDKKPQDIIRKAVRGMLPKSKLGRQMFQKLKVYAGPQHPHQAQKPEQLDL